MARAILWTLAGALLSAISVGNAFADQTLEVGKGWHVEASLGGSVDYAKGVTSFGFDGTALTYWIQPLVDDGTTPYGLLTFKQHPDSPLHHYLVTGEPMGETHPLSLLDNLVASDPSGTPAPSPQSAGRDRCAVLGDTRGCIPNRCCGI
jgi:hypothetical protein